MRKLSEPAISVALCTYNGERFLRQQLSSLVAQTRKPDELVVGDDGSSDATLAILEEFVRRAPFPTRILAANGRRGSTANFERTVESCSGEVIALCDQDDVWLPTKIERTLQAFADNPSAGLFFSDGYLIDETGQRTGDRLWRARGFGRRQQEEMERDPFARVMRRSTVTGSTLALRAEYRDLLLPFPAAEGGAARVMHDRWISIVLCAIGDIVLLPEPLIEYRLHPDQQIGIPWARVRRYLAPSVQHWGQLTISRPRMLGRIEGQLLQLGIIAERAAVQLDGPRRGAALANTRRCATHLEVRAALNGRRRQRVAAVIHELARGGYHRYSLGVASAAADILRR